MDIQETLDTVKEQTSERVKDIMEQTKESKLLKTSKGLGILDNVQEKIISRKLLVFAAATGLFVWAGLDADTWGMIAMCYIGGQSAIDFAKTWKG
jgi:hypothetical protein